MIYARFTQFAIGVMVAFLLADQAYAEPKGKAEGPLSGDTVQGSACYRQNDDEALLAAHKKAINLAREAALQRIKAYTENAERIANSGMEDSVVASVSRVGLSDVKIIKQEVKAKQVCVWLTAKPNSKEVAELIAQQLAAREVAKTAQASVVTPGASGFSVKVWTNRKDELFVEGDRLIIYVESEKDAYLKLDYYTAEGKVVHLVPNVFSNEARIQGGQTYSFGAEGSAAEFKIAGPFGMETIKALASMTPFDAELTPADQISEATVYLAKVQNTLKAKGKSAGWAEGAVALTTSNRDDLRFAQDRKEIDMPKPKVGTRSLSKTKEKPEQPIDIIGVPGRKKGERPIETMGTMGRSQSGGDKNP
jgi:hypothetical protein